MVPCVDEKREIQAGDRKQVSERTTGRCKTVIHLGGWERSTKSNSIFVPGSSGSPRSALILL